jgi:hypothetical protein
VEVSVQREAADQFLVKLATDEWEVNIRLSATDIRALVGSAHWHQRGTLQAGESAGAPVFWASDGKQARLLIGNDGQTGDVANIIPFRVVDEVVRRAIRVVPEQRRPSVIVVSPLDRERRDRRNM